MTLNKREWEVVSHSITHQRQNERVQQQSLYRVLEALSKRNDIILEKLVETGVFLDAPLLKSGDSAAPNASAMFPLDYPFDRITPMGWAAYTDDVAALERLYNLGADPSFPGPQNRDALWMALWGNSVHAWDWLKNIIADTHGINWNMRSTDGHRTTRLMDAVVRKNIFAVRDIIPNVDVSAVDYVGRTALHYNLLQDPYTEIDLQIGRMLVEYGAPIESEDHEGVAPAALAHTSEQQALMDNAILASVSLEAHARAEAQRNHISAQEPVAQPDPTEPGFPQIQKPVRFKKPFM